MSKKLSYKEAGVDIDAADSAKRQMAETLKTTNNRVLNKVGAFASLFNGSFPEYKEPVLVLKMEEPGSKQKLAFQHGRIESICEDMINHLVNDIIVMGAKPLCVQDAIICGKLEPNVVPRIVEGIATACKTQECVLVGGETSEQPGVIEAGVYILTASIIGIAERTKIIDGAKIKEGDIVVGVASNGLHTNGYSLVRALMTHRPEIISMEVGNATFLETILIPHRCYYKPLRELFEFSELHGMAHITGGGIAGNLNRVLPKNMNATIDLSTIEPLQIFKVIHELGNIEEQDMLKTFNVGVGMTLVLAKNKLEETQKHLAQHGCDSYPIGEIVKGSGQVTFTNQLRW